MSVPFADEVKVYLDPELIADIEHAAGEIDRLTGELDNQQLIISRRVNEMWDEHRAMFNTRLDYFAECSRIANLKSGRYIFAESGETLRRWCEVVATYESLDGELTRGYELSIEDLLDALTFNHLYKARKLYLNGKVKSPLYALAEAMSNKWSAEDMEFHFDSNKNSVKGGLISFLQKWMEKKLPMLELPKETAAEAVQLLNRLMEILK